MNRYRVLYINRNRTVECPQNDQIERLSQYADTHQLAVYVRMAPILLGPNITTVCAPSVPKIEALKGFMFTWSSLRAVRRLLKSQTFDLVHVQFAYPDGLAALKIKRTFGIPYIVNGRGDDILLYPKQNRYLKTTIQSVLADASAFIGESQHIIDTAVQLGLTTLHRFHIPNGIPEPFCESPAANNGHRAARQDGKRSVLFVGDLLPVKNVERMAHAFVEVAGDRADVEFRIRGVGPLKTTMEKIFRSAGIDHRVHWLPYLSIPELAPVARDSDVMVLPSISEGWPNVLMEAMACGTPVVGARVGGIPEQITSDDYGYLCDPYSVHDIADTLRRALDRKDWDHAKIAERGRQYTRADSVRKIAEVYCKVLAQ